MSGEAVSVSHSEPLTRSIHELSLVGDSGESSESNIASSVGLASNLVGKGHVLLVGVSDGSGS